MRRDGEPSGERSDFSSDVYGKHGYTPGMAGPPTSEYAQVTLIFSGSNVPTGAACTFGGTEVDGSPTLFLETLEGMFGTFIGEASVTTCTINEIRYKIGPEQSGPTYVRATNLAGDQGTDPVAPNTALLIRKHVPGKSARFSGRVFWPGVSDTDLNPGGTLTGAAITRLQDACDDLWSSMSNAGFVPRVFSEGSNPEPVSDFVLQPRVASQRRRLRR